MPPFINGILFGLIFLFAIGPAFFALIQISIQQGLKKAIFFALGISIADTFYVLITLFGVAAFLESETFKFWMAIFGAVILTSYAFYSWMKHPSIRKSSPKDSYNLFNYLLRGMLLNGLNPFMIVTWTALISTISINFEYSFDERIQFFSAMLVSIFCLDVSKAFAADKLKHLITKRFILIMNRTVALVTMFFTFRIFYFLFENYY